MLDTHSQDREASPAIDEETLYEEAQGWQWLRETPFWAISALLHMALFIILLNIALTGPEEAEKEFIFKTVIQRPDKKLKLDVTKPRDFEETIKVPKPKTNETLIVVRKPEEIITEIPKGTRLDTHSNVLKHEWLNDALGVGPGPAGDYGHRLGREGVLDKEGGEGTEPLVLHALDWLRRHQSPDGSWKARDFTSMCANTCKNIHPHRYGDGRGFPEHDVGVTGLAILAFAGFGHTHNSGTYKEFVQVVKKAAQFLKSVQVQSADPNTNGRYGTGDHEQWIYDHAIATMAMAELLAMSLDQVNLKRTVTEATRLCLHAQNHGYGWRYDIKPGQNDSSVTGWMVLALKAAKNARLDIPREEYNKAFKGALTWFDRATSNTSGKTGYQVPGDEGSRLAKGHPEPYPYSKELSCMTAVGVLSRLFGGESRTAPIVKRGVDILLRELPRWHEKEGKALSSVNLYYWYYGSYALFQVGRMPWKKWNEEMKKALKDSQRVGGDENGSWDPIGEWGLAGGRVYSTALGAMTLEVYYRFKRLEKGTSM